MASSGKSLSDFFGLSWSSWSEYTGELTNSDGDEEDNKNDSRRKSSDVMQLYSSDMQKFGLFPETDCFCTVVCSECNALVKPQGLLNHMRVRHKELVPGKISPEKIFKLTDSSSLKNSGEKPSAKHVLSEKLMSKLILNEKHSNKSSNDKLPNSPSDKHKSSIEKASSKFGSEKLSPKPNDKLISKSSSEKLSRTLSEKLKVPPEKGLGTSLLLDKTVVKTEADKFLKSSSDVHSKQTDIISSKVTKLNEKQSIKSTLSEKVLSKYPSPESKIFPIGERHLPRSGEKISVKSVLSEKLLSKVAATEKGISTSEKIPKVDGLKKGDSLLKSDRLIAKPVMKSLLKDKVLRNDPSHTIVPGTSLLRPLIHQDREPVVSAGAVVGSTTLSPPILTPQNLMPERHQSATDMPVLSRKRKFRERKALPTQYDPDRHCGVWCEYFNKFCMRSLTCKVHSVALRRAVVGRSRPFDQLLTEHKRAKEDQRHSKEDLDDVSEMSSQVSDRLQSSSEPSNSSFLGSPCGSPASSQALSPAEIVSSHVPELAGAASLSTPSTSTSPPIPLPSYQYPPYSPPDLAFPTASESMVTLSPHLSSPLLNVALPSLSPSHATRPPDSSEEESPKPRNVARTVNRTQLNKGKQFNVKHTAFPPKPLRTCLFQGRKSSGMFFIPRDWEFIRSGLQLSLVKGSKTLPISHASSTSTSQTLPDSVASHSSVSLHGYNDSVLQVAGSSSHVNAPPNFKSVLSTMCSPKTVLNRDVHQRVQRTQKPIANGPEIAIQQPVSSDPSLAISSDKLSQGMRISGPTSSTMSQQITYLTTSTPVTFQQVPIIKSQVLGQLQLQSKGAGGTLKLLSTAGGSRTLLVHQYQDGSGAES